jgi:hypothetical protein
VTRGELLTEIVRGLDAASIPHMVAGSIASTYHGEPRTTGHTSIGGPVCWGSLTS